MNIRVKFLGGAKSVTGSKYLLEIDEYRLLVDCGLFQGQKELRLRNWDDIPIEEQKIDAILLTHAHIDHSGYLPLLCKNGYQGAIHCTVPTVDLLEIMLTDSAKLQEEEADYANKKGYSKHKPARPLYTVSDAELVYPKLHGHDYEKEINLNENVSFKFIQAGHILGASSIQITINTDQGPKKLLFSGDLGPTNNPLHFSPSSPENTDILFVESTYGGRSRTQTNAVDKLREVIEACDERKGCLVIPAFSVGRTQLVLYYLWQLFKEMSSRPVYVDSPMAISVTDLYKKYFNYHRLESQNGLGHEVFDAPYVHYVRDQSRSRFLNTIKDRAIIISASGMATGGRILHHLFHRLPKENDTILFTGFLPEGTRGWRILNGEEQIKIFGEMVHVKANIDTMEELSAHAEHQELMSWIQSITERPKMTFLVHGEEAGMNAMKSELEKMNWNVTIPDYLEVYGLFDHV